MFSDDRSGFVSIGEVVPDAILEIRYYSTFNFIGDRIDGYELPVALLTLEAASRLKEVSGDMGGPFDFFGELSHPGYTGVTEEQYAARMLLRDAMLGRGFKPLASEWWHFTLKNEPYPDTFFTFPVR